MIIDDIEFEIVKCGFELFRTRSSTEVLNTKSIEDIYNITIPPMYKMFIQLFDFERFSNEIRYQNVGGEYMETGLVQHLPNTYDGKNPLCLDSFFSIEETFSCEFEWDDSLSENGYYIIASVETGGSLLLATKENMIDQIIHYTVGDQYVKVADNIFSFIQDLSLIVAKEQKIYKGGQLIDLYQNWGENFWRIREK